MSDFPILMQPLRYLKLLQSLLTLGMMLFNCGCSSLGESPGALFMMEEMKEQPVSPSNVCSSTETETRVPICSCDLKELGRHEKSALLTIKIVGTVE